MEMTPLVVFARAPRPGGAKTRLAPLLGEKGAARLARAFLDDTLSIARAVPGFEVVLACAGDPQDADLVEIAARHGVARIGQPGGGLGQRLTTVLADALARAGRALVIGSDAPTLPARLLVRAAAALERAELVLGPTADGGYYLIGARGRPPRLDGVRFSTVHALADTVALADGPVELLPPWYDVDTPDDLRLLRLHLALDRSVAPATRSVF
jgi:rSAM/selenodomain-associated transferase 1